MRRTTARLQDAAMTGDRDPTKAAQWLACTINAGLVAGAVCAVVAEGWWSPYEAESPHSL